MNKIQVPLASFRLAKTPDILACYGVGSCVVVTLYDPELKLAAMAHVMLPGKGDEGKDCHGAKYSGQAIEGMIQELLRGGSSRERWVAKMAGGAQMLRWVPAPKGRPPGRQNVEAIRKKLNQEKIPVVGQDVGKDFGRSVEFCTASGQMHIRTSSEGSWVI
jgi:chemotaxis protein CheD